MTNNTPETKDIPSSSVRPLMEIEWTTRGWTQRGTVGHTRSARVSDTEYVQVTSLESTDTWVTLPETVTWLNPTTVELVPGSMGVGVTTTGETIRGHVVGKLSGGAPYVRTISPRWGYFQDSRYAQELQSWTQLYPYPEEPVEPVEPLEPLEPLEPVEPLEPLEPLEPVEPLEPGTSWDRWEDVPEMTPVVASSGVAARFAYRKDREGRTEFFGLSRWSYSRMYPHGGPYQALGPFTRTEVDPTTGNTLP